MKYKVGDKVRIVKNCDDIHWNNRMNKWIGKVMTIRAIQGSQYRMKEDIDEQWDGWYWNEDMVDALNGYTKADLKVGMLVKYRDGQTRVVMPIENDLLFMSYDRTGYASDYSYDLLSVINSNHDIVEVYDIAKTYEYFEDYYTELGRDLIWKRSEEPKELTIDEISELLGYKVKVIE